MDFDDDRLYYSHQALQQDGNSGRNSDRNAAAATIMDDNDDNVNLMAVRRHFREFLRKSWLVWNTTSTLNGMTVFLMSRNTL
jgi:hypothetical protein